MSRRLSFAAALVALIAGCSRSPTYEPRSPVVAIQLDPASPEMALGSYLKVTAQGLKANGKTVALEDVVFGVDDPESLDVTPRGATAVLHAKKLGANRLVAHALGLSASVDVAITGPLPVSLAISPPELSLSTGGTQRLAAVATLSDGSTKTVTADSEWSVSDSGVAGVSNEALFRGELTDHKPGEVTVSAKYGALAATAKATISGATLNRIDVTPPRATIPLNSQVQFTAVAVYSDLSTEDVTARASWSSSNGNAVRIADDGTKGLADGIGPGEVTITAKLDGKSGTAIATVTTAKLTGLELSPAKLQLAKGTTGQLKAIALFADGMRQEVTFQARWTSANPLVARASATVKGAVESVAPGITVVNAEFLGMTASAAVEVSAATLQKLEVTPATLTLAKGSSAQLTATGTYSDATSQDVTALVTWASSDDAVVSASNAAGSKGLVRALKPGAVVVTATLDGQTGKSNVEATAATIKELAVTPASAQVAKGTDLKLKATVVYSDGNTLEVTDLAAWSSSDNATASVTTVGTGRGLVFGARAGSAVITAAYNGATGTSKITVTPAFLVSMKLAPLDPTLPKGTKVQLTAEGTYSDGTVQDVTSLVTWSMADPAVASVSNASPSFGEVTGLAVGKTTASATLSGKTVSTSVTVTPALLVAFKVNPTDVTLEYKGSQQETALALYSDATVVDVTNQCAWTSDDSTVASVTSSGTPRGLVSAGRAGQTTVTASFGGKTATVAVKVNAPKMTKLEVRPATVALPAGTSGQLRAFATYADGSSADVTDQASWTSSTAHVVVRNAPEAGKLFGMTVGTADVTATIGALSGTAQVTVTNALPDTLTISPTTVTLPAGLKQAFTVRAFYTDGSSQDVTAQALFTSADTTVVGLNGNVAQGIKIGGPIDVTAKFGGMTAVARVTVTAPGLVSLRLSTNALVLQKGTSGALRAIGTYSDGSTQDLTSQAVWTTSNGAVATVSGGNVDAVGAGKATVTATVQGLADSASITVETPVLTKVVIVPPNPVLRPNLIYPFKSYALYSDGTTTEVTQNSSWTSTNPSVAQPSTFQSYQGVWARGIGTATIKSAFSTQTGQTPVNVASATLNGVQISPAQVKLPVGVATKFSGVYAYSDGWAVEILNPSWSSSNPNVAKVDANGVVTAVATGSTTILVTEFSPNGQTYTAKALVNVTSAKIKALSINAPSTMVVGLAARATAVGTFDDGSVVDMGPSVLWSTSDTSLATVLPDVYGAQVTGKAAGSVTLMASFGGVPASMPVKLSAATLSNLALTVKQPTLPSGGTSPVTVTGTFSDGTKLDLTDSATWDATDPSIALVDDGLYTNALQKYVIAEQAGSTTLRAKVNGVVASAPVTVSGATVSSLQLAVGNNPPSASVTVPFNVDHTQLRVVGTFSNGATADVTIFCTFTPASIGPGVVATISNVLAGQVTPVAPGSETVNVVYAPAYIGQPKVNANATLTVQ